MIGDPFDPVTEVIDAHRAAVRRYVDQRIRAALIEEGVDPDAVERVAARAATGEFDPPAPTVTIRDDPPDTPTPYARITAPYTCASCGHPNTAHGYGRECWHRIDGIYACKCDRLTRPQENP